MDKELYVKVLGRLQAQGSRKEGCTADMKTKALKAMVGDEDAAEQIVASLVSDRFVDDLRYASAFAREKASISGWGAQKIRFMLMRKGIDRKTVDEALTEIDAASADRKLESVIAAKYRTLKEDPQWRLKLIRFALGRGYGYDQVMSAVDRVSRGSDN